MLKHLLNHFVHWVQNDGVFFAFFRCSGSVPSKADWRLETIFPSTLTDPSFYLALSMSWEGRKCFGAMEWCEVNPLPRWEPTAQDVIGIAATGSGKTLAFLLPAFSSLVAREKSSAANEWNLQIGFHSMKFLWIWSDFSVIVHCYWHDWMINKNTSVHGRGRWSQNFPFPWFPCLH